MDSSSGISQMAGEGTVKPASFLAGARSLVRLTVAVGFFDGQILGDELG